MLINSLNYRFEDLKLQLWRIYRLIHLIWTFWLNTGYNNELKLISSRQSPTEISHSGIKSANASEDTRQRWRRRNRITSVAEGHIWKLISQQGAKNEYIIINFCKKVECLENSWKWIRRISESHHEFIYYFPIMQRKKIAGAFYKWF